MSQTLPVVFLLHSALDLVLKNSSARAFLSSFGEALVRRGIKRKAAVIATAHFQSATPKLTADAHPGMIYDFGGFDPRLCTMHYPAPGAPEVARRAAELLTQARIGADTIVGRGYDHGNWVPPMLLFPHADVPVAQLSVQPQAGAAHHLRLGAALAPLPDEGVLIVGSGSTTHNLQAFFSGGYQADSAPAGWMRGFGDWVHEKAESGAADDIVHYRELAPLENHPAEEHFLPLPLAMGAAGPDAKSLRVHSSHQFGVLMMDACTFQ